MANKYKVTIKKGKEKEETEIEADDERHATKMLASLHGRMIRVEGMKLSCEKCKTITFHKYNEGLSPCRDMIYIIGTMVLGIFLCVGLSKIVPDKNIPSSLAKIGMVFIFGIAFVICKVILLPLLLLLTTAWTCEKCGEEWAP